MAEISGEKAMELVSDELFSFCLLFLENVFCDTSIGMCCYKESNPEKKSALISLMAYCQDNKFKLSKEVEQSFRQEVKKYCQTALSTTKDRVLQNIFGGL